MSQKEFNYWQTKGAVVLKDFADSAEVFCRALERGNTDANTEVKEKSFDLTRRIRALVWENTAFFDAVCNYYGKNPMRFKKKPIIVEAIRWDGTMESTNRVAAFGGEKVAWWSNCSKMRCETLEGPLTVSVGDWIIKGFKGEFYPCKPDIFEATYEPVEENGKVK